MCKECGDMKHNPFADKYKAKMANSKEKHEVSGAIKNMGKTKALNKRAK